MWPEPPARPPRGAGDGERQREVGVSAGSAAALRGLRESPVPPAIPPLRGFGRLGWGPAPGVPVGQGLPYAQPGVPGRADRPS